MRVRLLRAGLCAAAMAALALPVEAQLTGTVGKPKEEAPPKPAPTPRPKPRPKPKPQPAPRLALEIEQDGAVIPAVDHEVYLRRAAFAIILHSPDPSGVFLSARFEPEAWDIARQGGAFGNLFRSGITVADVPDNADRVLYVGGDILQWLNKEGGGTTGLDEITPVGPGFRGRRTVAKLFIGKDEHELSALPPRPIHLVAARATHNPATNLLDVTEVEYLKLHFDTVAPALKEKVDGQLKVVMDAKKPFAERTAALQDLARNPRDTLLAIDASSGAGTGDAAKAGIRSFIAAERAYAAVNGGFYDKPDCLVSPLSCHPKARVTTAFMSGAAEGQRDGYTFTFHQGIPATKDEVKKAKASPTSMKGFSLVAVPDSTMGGPSFCGDDTGRVCSVAAGGEIDTEAGRCPASCTTIQ